MISPLVPASAALAHLTSAPAVVQTYTSGNGGKPPQLGYLSQHTPLFLKQDPTGEAEAFRLAAPDFESAATEARAMAKTLVTEKTMPEDYGYAPMIERRAGAVALLQGTDGAFYVNELVSTPAWAPSPFGQRAVDLLVAQRRANEPDWKLASGLTSMAGAADAVKAVFAGDQWWDLRAGNALAPSA